MPLKILVDEVDLSSREHLKSENYTLSQTKGLSLFEISYIEDYEEDKEDQIHISDCIEFWAPKSENNQYNVALNFLQKNLEILLKHNEKTPFCNVDSLIEIADYINEIDPKLLDFKNYNNVFEVEKMSNHVHYCIRKFDELVSKLDEHDLIQPILNNKYELERKK